MWLLWICVALFTLALICGLSEWEELNWVVVPIFIIMVGVSLTVSFKVNHYEWEEERTQLVSLEDMKGEREVVKGTFFLGIGTYTRKETEYRMFSFTTFDKEEKLYRQKNLEILPSEVEDKIAIRYTEGEPTLIKRQMRSKNLWIDFPSEGGVEYIFEVPKGSIRSEGYEVF